jgi:replicative DNA helicase
MIILVADNDQTGKKQKGVSMSIGLAFLHQALKDRADLSFLDACGLEDNDFSDEELEVVGIIKEHIKLYSVIPAITTVEALWGRRFPEFDSEPIRYWADEVIKRAANKLIMDNIEGVISFVANNKTDEAQAKIKKLYLQLQERRSSSPVVNVAEVVPDVIKEHDKKQVSRREALIPFGFPYIDKVSGGSQPGDFNTIVGRTRVGKTYLLLKMANEAYLAGKSPLFITTEMSPTRCVKRLLALRNKIPYNAIKNGRLIWHMGRQKIMADYRTLLDSKVPFLMMKSSLSTTLEDIIIYVKEIRPDCVYVDGAYLLRSDESRKLSSYERVSHGANVLKMLAQEAEIPVIATYQTKRHTSGGLDDVYMSDIIAQNSSLMIGIKNVEEKPSDSSDWEKFQYKRLEILKGREGERGVILAVFDLDKMIIQELEVLSDSESN